MIVPLAFWLFLLGALMIGWRAGDSRDRRIVLAIFAAAVATALCDLFLETEQSLVLVALIDLALLGAVWRYALTSQRYWPIWFTGFHLAATLIGFGALIMPVAQRPFVDLMSALWAAPALVAMVVGILADRRNRIGTGEAGRV